MKIVFSFLSLMVLSLLSSSFVFASSKNQFTSTAIFALLKHKNADYNSSEKGWIPGLNFGLTHRNKNMSGTISADIYSGDAAFTSEVNSDTTLSATTNEKLLRASYRLESAFPRRLFQIYSQIAMHRWNRNIKSTSVISGVGRKYEWWAFEAGVQANFVKSRSNLLQANIGLSQTFLNEIQIDLRQLNLGKPLFKPSSKTGASMSLLYAHFFNTHEGIKFAVSAQYWQFGKATKNINNFGQVADITESASESTLISGAVSYFHQF